MLPALSVRAPRPLRATAAQVGDSKGSLVNKHNSVSLDTATWRGARPLAGAGRAPVRRVAFAQESGADCAIMGVGDEALSFVILP